MCTFSSCHRPEGPLSGVEHDPTKCHAGAAFRDITEPPDTVDACKPLSNRKRASELIEQTHCNMVSLLGYVMHNSHVHGLMSLEDSFHVRNGSNAPEDMKR
eukprot:3697845-Amphidinium_carterae.2